MMQLGKAIDQVCEEKARKLKREDYKPILSSTLYIMHLETYLSQKQPTNFSEEANFPASWKILVNTSVNADIFTYRPPPS